MNVADLARETGWSTRTAHRYAEAWLAAWEAYALALVRAALEGKDPPPAPLVPRTELKVTGLRGRRPYEIDREEFGRWRLGTALLAA